MSDLMERFDIISAFVPVNLAAANNTGDYISLKHASRVACVLFKGVGTAGDDPTIGIQQATTVAGAGAKPLAIARIWTKQDTLLSTVGTFTLVTQTAANTYTDATSAEDQAVWSVVVDADELDVDNNFDCLRMYCTDVGGNAQIGAGFYIMESKAPQAILPSPIVD